MPNNAQVTLTLASQVAPQIAQTANAYKTLSAAEQAAERSATAYAKALTQVALADAKTATEEQRLAVQVANTAKAETQAAAAALRLASAQNQAASGNSFAAQTADAFKSQLIGIVGPAAIATAALTALKGAADLAQLGAQADLVRIRFDSLAQSAGIAGNELLAALRKGSGREISDLNLQLAANKAQLLGVAHSAQEFGVLMSIARDRAQQMGITTTQAFDDLVTGLGRGSRLILDNLGILVNADEANKAYARSIGKTVSQLTDQERKQALINQVLKDGQATLAATGGAVESAAAGQARLSASWDNVKASAGSAIAQGVAPFVNSLSDLINMSDGTKQGIGSIVNGLIDFNRQIAGLPPLTADQTKAQQAWTRSVQEWIIARGVQLGLMEAQPVNSGGGGSFELPTDKVRLLATAYDEDRIAAGNAQIASQQFTQAIQLEGSAKVDAQIHTAELARQQAQLDADSRAASQGLFASGDQALALAAKYGIAVNQARFLISEQRKLALAAGPTEGRSERDTATDRDEVRVALAGQATAAELAHRNQIIQTGTATQVVAQRQKEYNDAIARFGKGSAQAIDAQTALINAQQAAAKAGRGRVSAAESTALQLNTVEQNSGLQLAKTQRENLERLRDQAEDFDVRRSRAQEDFAAKRRSLLAHGQRAQAAELAKDFATEQRRAQEDFDRQNRRTLRNNAEGTGDIGASADLRASQIGDRAALRGVRGAGLPSAGGAGGALPIAPAARGGIAQLTISGVVSLDGKQVGMGVWPTIEVLVDDELSVSLQQIGVPGSGQAAVAGAG